MRHFDTIIRAGTIVDGTGAPSFKGDLGISAGRIAAVAPKLAGTADEEIDAAGKIVAPGHVTQHCHYDAQLFWDPYCSNSGEHGVTTVLNANCGFSVAPVRKADQERTMMMLETTEQIPVEYQKAAMPWDWETFPDFMRTLEQLPKGVNVMTYLPLNPLLIYVMGVEGAKTRRPTKQEIAEMHRLINEAMDAGAAGISMSVMGEEGNSHLDYDGTPMPTDLLHDDDTVEICRALADRGEGLIQVLSQIAIFGNFEISEKLARMAKGSGARVIHNAVLTNDAMPEMSQKDIEWLTRLRAEGLDISGAALINRGWVEAGVTELDTAGGQMKGVRRIIACQTDEDVIKLLQDPGYVSDFVQEYSKQGPANGAAGLEGMTIIDVGGVKELAPYLEKTLGEASEERGQHVVETLAEFGWKSNLGLQLKSMPFAANDPTIPVSLLRCPAIAPGVSDGGAHTQAFSNGHYGTELLIWLVREEKLMTIEEMHHQLALKVARTIQLDDRGALLPGFAADILIYDLDALYLDTSRHEVVHDMPNNSWRRKPKSGGYDRILVNGVTTHIGDKPTGDTPGRVLRVTTDFSARQAVAAE
ncbi:MAG: amidohydrolase family protein [Parvibaculaceae bacterium]